MALTIALVFMVIIAGIETMAYSVRVAAVRTQKLAVSFALFNLLAQVSRLSLMVIFPLMGSMVDRAIENNTVPLLEGPFRLVIAAITAGSIMGAVLIPFFVGGFSRLINHFVDVGSVPRLFFRLVEHRRVWLRPRRVEFKNYADFIHPSFKNLPRNFFIINIAVVAIYTVGSLASIYAGALVPQLSVTTSQLAGAVNGLGAVLLMIFVDPTMAMITDEAMQGKRPLRQVQSAVTYLVAGKVIGTVIAQALFLPTAAWIAYTARLVASL
ncbi:MAG: DUF2837 family protein [Bacillota bacterium]